MRILRVQNRERLIPEDVVNLFRNLADSDVELEPNIDIITVSCRTKGALDRQLVAVRPVVVSIQDATLYQASEGIIKAIQGRSNIFPDKVIVYGPGACVVVERSRE